MGDTVYSISDISLSELALSSPRAVQGGSYITSISYGDSNADSCFIQLPVCTTKQGIVERSRRHFCDLMYQSSDSAVLEWIEKVNERCQQLIFEKRNTWFTSNLTEDDIESAFTSPIRLYQSGKSYLLRVHIKQSRDTKTEIIYSEDGELLTLEEVANAKRIIPMIKLECIRFSSRAFSLEVSLCQMMILKEAAKPRGCLITNPNYVETSSIDASNVSNAEEEQIVEMRPQNENTVNKEDSEELEDLSKTMNVVENSTPELIVRENENDIVDSKMENNEPELTATESENIIEEPIQRQAADMPDNDDLTEKSPEENELGLEEVSSLEIDENDSPLSLTHPNQVYEDIYRAALQKAKLAKKVAVEAYLEAKRIKNTYLVGDIDSSDEEDEEYR